MVKVDFEHNRKRTEYWIGKDAYRAGVKADDCPYYDGCQHRNWRDMRMSWMAGWLDARTQSSLAHIFSKYKIEFP